MNLRQGILHVLKRVHPYLMPEEALRVDVCGLLAGYVSQAEVREELLRAEDKGWVCCVRDEVTERMKWKLTDEGRVLNIL